MRLKRLAINRLPGISQPFEIEAAGAGFHVVFGPNGIGKSSICRAVEGLYWEAIYARHLGDTDLAQSPYPLPPAHRCADESSRGPSLTCPEDLPWSPRASFASGTRRGRKTRFGALGLVLNVEVLFNTRYLQAAVDELTRQGRRTTLAVRPSSREHAGALQLRAAGARRRAAHAQRS